MKTKQSKSKKAQTAMEFLIDSRASRVNSSRITKRAQAAMEFLMTYGWAILVVIITIAALGYFGIVNPGNFLPKTCTFVPGLACTEFVVDEYFTTIVLQNSFGKDITITKVNISGKELNGLYQGERDVRNGKEARFSIKHPPKNINKKAKADVYLTYQTKDLLNHTVIGEISSSIDEFNPKNILGNNADNLLAYWYFGEGEGEEAMDLSGNENTGSCNPDGNCHNWTSNGKFGNAAIFSSSPLNVGNDNSLDFNNTKEYTWEIWTRRDSLGLFFSKGIAYYIQTINQGMIYKLSFQIGSDQLIGLNNLDSNKWHHIIVTHNNGYVQLFLDGELDNNATITTTSDTSTDLTIASTFAGTIDSALIYNKAFSAAEVKARYEATK